MKRTAIAALFLLFTCAANADNETDGWRIGGSLAYGDFKRDDNLIDDSSVGFKIFAQYRFNSWFGTEGAYYNSSDFTGDATFGAEGGSTKISYEGFSIAAIGYVPIPSDNFDLFIKAGYVNFPDVKLTVEGMDTNSGTEDGLTLGLGASLQATDEVGIRLEFELYETNRADLWTVGLGAEYRF